MTAPDELTDLERGLLELERSWWLLPGSKKDHVEERFGFGEARYYRLLSGLVDRPAALQHDPLLVRRLRRSRAARLEERASRMRHPAGSRL